MYCPLPNYCCTSTYCPRSIQKSLYIVGTKSSDQLSVPSKLILLLFTKSFPSKPGPAPDIQFDGYSKFRKKYSITSA